MMVEAFCELFVAGCLEVENRCEPGSLRRYRVIDGLDPSLLTDEERAVARSLSSFKTFETLLEEAGEALPEAREELLGPCAGLLDEALAYQPPVSSCSV